jgi:hypothetical protein
VITDAQGATSAELSRRQKRYVITMLFRLACFVGIFFVTDVWRWVLGACAVFLPYIAVILANQADTRGRGGPEAPPDPAPDLSDDRPELEQVVVIEPDETARDDEAGREDEPRSAGTAREGDERRDRDDAA